MKTKITVKPSANGLAWCAVHQLIAAYKAGERNGGHIEWNDIDDAYNLAKQAARKARAEHKAKKK